MTEDWTEYKLVEKPVLNIFDRLGWDVYDQEEEPVDVPENRSSKKRAVLEDKLKENIKRLNPWINENNLNKAAREITRVEASDCMDANEKIYEKLVQHISLEQNTGKGKKHRTVKFIDWENPENNEFTAINQFKVEGPRETVKPDVTVFVNGIPLGVIECKNPTIAEPETEGLNQMARYQNIRDGENEGAEELFWYNQFSVVTWKDGAVMGTYGTPREEYKSWKDPYPADASRIKEDLGVEKIDSQTRLIYSLFKKDRLLDMMRNFTVFENKGQGTVKMVARYQQYRAVQKALKRIDKRDRERNGGVIWHTQGSGKSLTMLFLGLKLRRLKDNPTLLLVTDRTALDDQIHTTFQRCGFPNPKQAESIEDLKQKLKANAGETITTLIQKFQHEDSENFPVLSTDEDIYVMVDEAHRTQYKELANNMRTGLPNAFYVGFTGTPIEKNERNTRRTFGNYIDKYTIDQSIEDNTTVPILYQGRLADVHLEGADLDRIFDRVFSDKTEEEKEEIKKRYAREQDLAEAPKRIQKICLDLIDHYEEKISVPFKGMIVTTSRQAAVNYKKQLEKLNGPEAAVVISGGHNDSEEMKKYTPSDSELDTLKDRFQDPEDDLKFLIVCDMLLTGFDAPTAQVMYLDKPLREHSLLQAVARVNRPYEEKNYGLIIDYYGISDDLYKALENFSRRDVEKALTPIEDEVPKLEAAHGKAVSFFNSVDMDNLEECMTVLENEETRIEFNNAFKEFSKYMDIIMPEPAANEYKEDLKKLGKIYRRAKNLYRDESMDLTGAGEKVKYIIQENISSSGIKVLNDKPVSIMDDEEFEKRIDGLDSDKAKYQEMEQGLKKEISVRFNEDPTFYKSLQEKVEELIEKYKEKRLEEKEIIQEFENMISAIRNREEKAKDLGLNDTTELAFYNSLSSELKDVSEEELRNMARDFANIFETKNVVEWDSKIQTRKEIKRNIKLRLLDLSTPIDNQQIRSLTNQIVKIGKEHY